MTDDTTPHGSQPGPHWQAQEMHGTWALPVGCYNILVKHAAVIRSYPGGVRAFERDHRPFRKNWVLFMVMALTEERLGPLLAKLKEAGLVPGVDLAVADVTGKPYLECPGVAFEYRRGRGWMVNICPEPTAPDGSLPPPRASFRLPATRDAEGRPLPGMMNLFHGGRVFCVPQDEDEERAWARLREEVLAARMAAWLRKHADVREAPRQPPASQQPSLDDRGSC